MKEKVIMANLVPALALPERKLLAEPAPASSAANDLSATHGADITDERNRRRRQECTFRPMTNVLTGIFWFLLEFPNSSRGMNFQSPSIPSAGASAGAFARDLPRLRGRVDAEDTELARIAVNAAHRYESINIGMHIMVSMRALRTR